MVETPSCTDGRPLFWPGLWISLFLSKIKIYRLQTINFRKKRMMKLMILVLTSSILLMASGFKLFDDSPRNHTLDKRYTPSWPKSVTAPPSSGSTKAKIKWPIRAVALLSGARVSGMVNFTQDNPRALVKIDVNIRGLKAGQQHGFHVHEFGVTGSCASAGSIFFFL